MRILRQYPIYPPECVVAMFKFTFILAITKRVAAPVTDTTDLMKTSSQNGPGRNFSSSEDADVLITQVTNIRKKRKVSFAPNLPTLDDRVQKLPPKGVARLSSEPARRNTRSASRKKNAEKSLEEVVVSPTRTISTLVQSLTEVEKSQLDDEYSAKPDQLPSVGHDLDKPASVGDTSVEVDGSTQKRRGRSRLSRNKKPPINERRVATKGEEDTSVGKMEEEVGVSVKRSLESSDLDDDLVVEKKASTNGGQYCTEM